MVVGALVAVQCDGVLRQLDDLQTDRRTATAFLTFSFCSCANRNVNRWERIWPDRTGSCVGDGPVVLGFVDGQRGLRGVGGSVRVGHRQAERT